MSHPSSPVRSRRWCVPPAVLADSGDTLEGSAILDEFRSPLGVYLWQRVRDVALWAGTHAGERAGLFAPSAADLAVLTLVDAAPEDLPSPAVEAFDRLLREPTAANADDVARAAEAIATWALGRGAGATALAFTQAAAIASPGDAGRALAVGALAAELGQPARGETWLWRTVALARRAGVWATYVRAYLELGAVRERTGDASAARRLYLRAARAARRHTVVAGRSEAYHGMMRVALRRGQLDDAERLGKLALRATDEAGAGLLHDLADVAVRRGDGARVVPVLRALLHERTDAAARAETLQLLGRAAAQAGDRVTLEEVWPAVEELARAAPAGAEVRRALLELARATAAVGAQRRAATLARAAWQNASNPEEREDAAEILRSLVP